jgi:hypothetical protein
MSIDVKPEVVIRKPRAQKPLSPGRLVKGAQVDRVSKFMGRTFGYRYEVVDASGDDYVVMKVEQPFPMQIRYQLDALADGSTRASIHATGDATGFFKVALPLMRAMVKRNITNDLETLKEYVEGLG